MRLALSVFALLLVQGTCWAVEFQVPPLTGPVVDQAHVLNPEAADRLDAFLRRWHEQGGAQIQVATVSTLAGLSIEEASIKITDQWKLGKSREDRGLLLLLAPTEHRVRIEVGRGLEGDVPDAIANRIVNEVIVPRLREGSFERGIWAGVLAIGHYTDPKLSETLDNADIPQAGRGHRSIPINGLKYLIWLVIFLVFLWPRKPGRGGPFIGGFGGGGWGGGGSFGSGGGWSGGGGGFSGGGASGSW